MIFLFTSKEGSKSGGQLNLSAGSSLAPKQHWPEKHGQQIVAPSKGKRKTRRVKSAGLASALAV